MKCRQQ